MGMLKHGLSLEGDIQANNLDSASVASRANLNVIGRQSLCYRIVTLAAAGTVNVTVREPIRVIDCWMVKTAAGGGGAGETLTVSNAGAAISSAMGIGAAADTTVVRTTTINRTNRDIAAGGTLRVVTTGAGNDASVVYVLAVRN